MRRLLFALMIVLLPLRGWVGDAMAMQLLSGTTQAPQHTLHSTAHSGATMTAHGAEAHVHPAALLQGDCPGHAAMTQAPADPPQQADSGDSGDCGTCVACQICHSVALTPVTLHLGASLLPAGPLPASSHAYFSAERALGFKPPIF